MAVEEAKAGRARNRRGEGGRLREDIVTAAAELLDESGAARGITLRAVARRVGVTAPAIYPHFSDPRAILLAVVTAEFARLRDHIRAAVADVEDDAVARLLAACSAYLDYARTRPQRYLVLLGGVWDAREAVRDGAIDHADVVDLGQDTIADLISSLQRCVDEGRSASTDVPADAVALWVGLHGLAHQRIVSTAFPWPAGIEGRLVERLACLRPPDPLMTSLARPH